MQRYALIALALVVLSALGASPALETPATQPSTQPAAATRPTKQVSPEAAALLEQVRQAYAAVQAVTLEGEVSADIQADGQTVNDRSSFTATYSAPVSFRHQATSDLLMGSNGAELYAYDQDQNVYLTEALKDPTLRFASAGPPGVIGSRLRAQNPSLAMVVSQNAADTLTQDFTTVERGEDQQLDGAACGVLRMTDDAGVVADVLIDPQTSLVRRIKVDARKSILAQGATDVPKADIAFDYSRIDTATALAAEAFAWAPPEGARRMRAPTAGAGPGGQGEASALVGKEAPDFTLKNLEGNDVTLSSHRGSVVVLDFWATWCGPCVVSMPGLDQLNRDLSGQGLKVFAVNLREDHDKVQGFMNSRKLGLVALLDGDGAVGNSYQVTGIPQTVVIDKAGVVREVFMGSGQEQRIRKAVEEALGG